MRSPRDDRAGLTGRDRTILAFERDWVVSDGHKQQAIREAFGFSPSYYYAQLARLIARPEAEREDPLLVRRLRRDRRRRSLSTGLNEQVGLGRRRPMSK